MLKGDDNENGFKTNLISDFLPNKTLSCICIAIPFDWVNLHWYASGADRRSVGRLVGKRSRHSDG